MKRIILCVLLLCGAAYSRACTVCGSSASNQYLGILPQFQKHFIGMQYQYRGFKSEHRSHEAEGPSSFSKEHYSTIQAWGRFNAGKRIQLFAFVPYVTNLQMDNGFRKSVSGLGDITLLANYSLTGERDDIDCEWKHKLQAGGGIKLPTGSYDERAIAQAEGLPNMQPGTRSWDVIANANYTVRNSTSGLNVDASYTITTANPQQYKYGNRLTAGAMGFYWLTKKKLTLLPQAGVRLDVAGADYDNFKYRWKNGASGGSQLFASIGVQAYYKRAGVQFTYHHPLVQNYASGLVKSTGKADAGVYFLF